MRSAIPSGRDADAITAAADDAPRTGPVIRPPGAHERYPDDWLRQILQEVRTIAMVGASANPVRPSYYVMKYLLDKGYRVMPVNPGLAGQEVLGQKAYASLDELPERPDMVDIFRNSEAAGPITDDAIRAGAKVVWMQFNVRNDEAAQRAEAAGVRVVMNRCPKVEYARLHGELGRQGLVSNVLSSRKRTVKATRKLM